MDEKGYYDEYIISRDFLEKHKKEHYDLKDDEVIFCSDSYITLEDIYNDAVPICYGKWELFYHEYYHKYVWRCSSCKKEPKDSWQDPIYTHPEFAPPFKYCPHCGIKMKQ